LKRIYEDPAVGSTATYFAIAKGIQTLFYRPFAHGGTDKKKGQIIGAERITCPRQAKSWMKGLWSILLYFKGTLG